MRNYKKEYQKHKENNIRIPLDINIDTANKFKEKIQQNNETVQGHLKNYINNYIKEEK